MVNKIKYRDDDLVAVVWPRRSESLVRTARVTWETVARGRWAMDPAKADRVRVLLAVFDDVVKGAWAVTGVTHQVEVPAGKSRQVSRSEFDVVHDRQLDYLVEGASPLGRRRNPQATMALRDLPGASALVEPADLPAHGVVRLGEFTLRVFEDGHADLQMPVGAALTVRTAS
jgi:hypothetical protein